MAFWDLFRRKNAVADSAGRDVDELARRLGMTSANLRSVVPAYREFSIPKRAGGTRNIAAPQDTLKALHRTIHRRLLARLPCHSAATGFRRTVSIVRNAAPHAGKRVVVRMDLQQFFESTSAKRVEAYFRAIGWNAEASRLLTNLCTYKGGLPQGAPTSPALSNLVNYRLDVKLAGIARRAQATYTRYADDLTFSFVTADPGPIHETIRLTKLAVVQEGFKLHEKKKLHIRRRHDRQIVTGLVVNDRVNLPRATRRWLRAVEHREQHGGCTLTPVQLQGWRALRAMITSQSATSQH